MIIASPRAIYSNVSSFQQNTFAAGPRLCSWTMTLQQSAAKLSEPALPGILQPIQKVHCEPFRKILTYLSND